MGMAQEREARGDTTAIEWYTVAGERHGVSFFPLVHHPEVEYEAGEALTFDRYHTHEVMYAWLQRWTEIYPNLVKVEEVARSFEGRPILQVTLTNRDTGPATEKPAAYFEGGRHSGEVTSSESVMWLLEYLLEGYGRDEEITRLLDSRAIYLKPQNNPDGSSLYLHTAQRNRSTVRPHDTDRDGLLDEDPEEDLDGDGVMYQIRYPVRPGHEDEGNAIVDPRDPSGRIMRNAPRGEGDWVVLSEGIDSDGDGRFNEDGIGGLDLHRNYPENWRPDTGHDRTGRGYTQSGAGAFPLSENETRATVLFLLENPNVSVANVMDTRVPMHLRPPSTSASAERMYPQDRSLYEYFDSLGVSITGYPWAGDVYEVYATRNDTTLEGEPRRPGPLFGHGPDFGYWYYGSIWYGDELWNGGAMEDYNEDGRLDEIDALAWDDRHNGGKGFREWEPFQHPTLGDVEIGGFHPKFFSQNGPPEVLEEWIRKQALFNLQLALHLPLLELVAVDVSRAAQDPTSPAGVGEGSQPEAPSRPPVEAVEFDVTVGWRNVGGLPTALQQAQLVKIVQQDRAVLDFDEELMEGEDARVQIVEPSVRDKTVYAGWTDAGAENAAVFRVRVAGEEPVEGTLKVLSTRGGSLEAPVRLDPKAR